MNATISILFYLKRAKANAQGLAPIFQRITINGKRLDNSIGKFVDPSKWHPEMSKMRGNSEEARLINAHLDNLRTKILIAYPKFVVIINSEIRIKICRHWSFRVSRGHPKEL